MGVALTAFDTVGSYETADGPGELPLAEFYLPVGDTPHRETALPPGALITGVTLPAAPVASHSRYWKVRECASYAFAIGSVAAALDVRDGVVHDVRLAFGAVASRPWRAQAAERVVDLAVGRWNRPGGGSRSRRSRTQICAGQASR
jgi:xanthine dehydrogenase YagS FAD-binding subunit